MLCTTYCGLMSLYKLYLLYVDKFKFAQDNYNIQSIIPLFPILNMNKSSFPKPRQVEAKILVAALFLEI